MKITLSLLLLAAPALTQVTVTDLDLRVEIVDGVASTTLVETLHNAGRRQAEATWVLPLPDGAVADDFRMTMNGELVQGEVLAAEQARDVYEGIVRSRRDPGLLEYVGRGCLRARVFPIPPRGDVQVQVTYRHILPEVAGQRRWSFPVAAAGLQGRPPQRVSLDLQLRSRRPIRNVLTPIAGLQVLQKGDFELRASYEGPTAGLGGQEVSLQYSLSEREFGLDLLSTRAVGEEEGTFLMMISPRRDLAQSEPIPRAITFVLDTSGSMRGPKMDQARGALRFFLNSLQPADLFNVVPFSTEAQPFFPAPVLASAKNVARALKRAERLNADGGTNIVDGLERGLRGMGLAGHASFLVFLTDGVPTVGEKGEPQIQARVAAANQGDTRLFVFGVGNDVNTRLLDSLASKNGGARDYVRPQEDIEIKTSVLFSKISRPVLTNLELSVEGVELSKVSPGELPDLFAGGRLAVFGRYRGAGPVAVRLKGRVGETVREYVYEATFAEGPVASLDFVPSLWAERRVGVLLDAIRMNGQDGELIGEVQRLGRRYRIVTPYTSHLILEPGLGHGSYRGAGDSVPVGGSGAGGGAAPGRPGPVGPSTPGPASPGAAPGSLRSPTSPGPARRAAPTLDQLALRLRDAGVLPADASPKELRDLASEVVRELRDADRALQGLGREASGSKAVEDSAYLARLMASGPVSGTDDFFLGRGGADQLRGARDWMVFFHRRVRDKAFVLRAGVWTDLELVPDRDGKAQPRKGKALPRRVVSAFSDEYFALLRSKPALAPYFAFSSRLVLVFDGEVYEVQDPKPARGQ